MDVVKEVRVGIRELRGNLSRYLKEAAEGTSVLVTSRDVVIAELKAPPAHVLPPRRPGALKGQIHMADDFDTWPEDILDAMEVWDVPDHPE
jgi:antitoxin (DNA-binding transcriptional repressor) of toxin-antitoxin stability system